MRRSVPSGYGEIVTLPDRGSGQTARCHHCESAEGSFCAGLQSDQERALLSILCHVRVDDGAAIFREGDPALSLYAVASGAVKIYKMLPDGRRQITGFLFRGDLFGLSMDGGHAYTAEALGPVLLCRFGLRRLDGLFREIPQLEKRLLSAVTHELGAAHEQMLLLGRKTAREKVATFLVNLWRRKVTRGELPSVIGLPMSRADIADYLGLTIETVSRTLSQFRREGLIVVPDVTHVSVANAEGLARIAEGS